MLTAIRRVKHEGIAVRLQNLSEGRSSGWQEDPANRELVEWVSGTHLNLPRLRDNLFWLVPFRSHSGPPFP